MPELSSGVVPEETKRTLVTAVLPYFLKREAAWFERNLDRILKIRKSRDFWQQHSLLLEKDQVLQLSQLLRELDQLGYEKVLKVRELGEFSHRGGLVEIFPVNLKYAVRIEFLGNKIQRITKLPTEIEQEKAAKKALNKKLKSQKKFSGLDHLEPGNYVVHLDHGTAQFSGFQKMKDQKFYVLEYAKQDKLYVPEGLERKLSYYVGFTKPKISRLGGILWQKTKAQAKKGAEKLAKELLEIYAQRELSSRLPYPDPSLMDQQIASDFPHQETPDQIRALKDIEQDLTTPEPMDRILCGDVGFGKTEIALRTAVRAINAGYQAVMLCPTTILANQHYHNFKQRLKDYPIKIGALSRLQTSKQQTQVVEGLKKGTLDLVVGTHRLLSDDVQFKKLGLLIIDDEHRFGVSQKEKLKKIRTELDVLSLSATPIPRTLYLSLSSIKDITLIKTPPPGRQSIETKVGPYSKSKVKKAIQKEINRGGQVFYLHNRVDTIKARKQKLEEMFENQARFGIVHGRLSKKRLSQVMQDFQNQNIDVLVATTIIEAGLDFPKVNTLIVEDATQLGLAEAYQIRGRIGRRREKARAFFFYPPQGLSEKAKQRLQALKQAQQLGSGYQIALKDLELRGAGNILGKEQSGNINAVGLNLYCQMLSYAIEKMRHGSHKKD